MNTHLQKADFVLVRFTGAAAVMTVFLASPQLARAQVSYTSLAGTPYTETFDTLTKSGGVRFDQNVTLPGWYAYRLNSGTSDQIIAADGSSGTGGLYSFGVVNDGDRALGSTGSDTPGNLVWAVRISNDSGQDITSFTIGYTGEQWRYSGLRNFAQNPQTVQFSYAVLSDADMPSSTRLLNMTATSGFTDVNELDFTSPVTTGTIGPLIGNDTQNRTHHSTTINATIPAGQDLWLRWNDINHDGNDHGMAIDDFSFAATPFQPVPAPPAVVSLGIGGLVLLGKMHLRLRRRRQCADEPRHQDPRL